MLTARWTQRVRGRGDPDSRQGTSHVTQTPGTVQLAARWAQLHRNRLRIRRDWHQKIHLSNVSPTSKQSRAAEPEEQLGSAPTTDAAHVSDADSDSPHTAAARPTLFGSQRAWAGPALRHSIISKIAATKKWRPKLAYQLLPKYLPVMDGPCTSFLLGHLCKLRPESSQALTQHLPVSADNTSHLILRYLHQPVSQPVNQSVPYKHPRLQAVRLRAQGFTIPPLDHCQAELHEFGDLVRSICHHSTHKLRAFSGGALTQCVVALGSLHVTPCAQFWEAWEATTLPRLSRFTGQGHIKALHLGPMLAGITRCRHTPSERWQQAYFAAVRHALGRQSIPPAGVMLLCEGCALACLHTQTAGKLPAWQLPADMLQEVCSVWERQVVQGSGQPSETTGTRFLVAPLLAVAAQHAQVGVLSQSDWAQGFVLQWLQRVLNTQGLSGRADVLGAVLWCLATLAQQDTRCGPLHTAMRLAAKRLLSPFTKPTASHVHMTVCCLSQCHPKPTASLQAQVLQAVQSALPLMSPQQVVDVLTVLADWRCRPSMAWSATVSVYLHTHHNVMSKAHLKAISHAAQALALTVSPSLLALMDLGQ